MLAFVSLGRVMLFSRLLVQLLVGHLACRRIVTAWYLTLTFHLDVLFCSLSEILEAAMRGGGRGAIG